MRVLTLLALALALASILITALVDQATGLAVGLSSLTLAVLVTADVLSER